MAAPQLLVFDLDGTLVDSQTDLANSVNATLLHFGKPALPVEVIAGYIGDGVTTLVRRSLAHAHLINDQADPHDDALVDSAVQWFIAYYRLHLLDATTVYPGVLEALRAIRSRHPKLLMAILTNKPVGPSRTIAAHFGFEQWMFQTYGGNSFASKKPNPEGLQTLIAEASQRNRHPVDPRATVMIGDSHVDIETGRAAGCVTLGCAYGLSPTSLAASAPDFTVEHASQWPLSLGL